MHELQHRKGSNTRDRILDVAEAAILEKGFAATSIDELIAAVGITKNGFFYHFKDKSELAKALLVRYVAREDTLFDDLFRRADELDEDPLHGFLVGLKMMSEVMADLPAGSRPPCRHALGHSRGRNRCIQGHQGQEGAVPAINAVPRIHPRGFSRHVIGVPGTLRHANGLRKCLLIGEDRK